MISNAMQFTWSALNKYLQAKYGLNDDITILNNLVDVNGSLIIANQNKVVISLINVEKETAKPFYVRNQKLPDKSYSDVDPFERYNLDILVSSNFDDYAETLKFLEDSILFFQINNVIDKTSYPDMPEGLKLEYEIEKTSYQQMLSLWAGMGVKHQPSVIYKIRIITLQASETE